MPRYRYNAVDAAGKPASGELEAAGLEAARQELSAAGLDPQSISLSEVPQPGRRQGWLSTEEAVELARGLAEMTKAGLPLAGGLRAMARDLPRGRLPEVLRQMSSQLEAGATLDQVIQAQGRRFPAHVRGLVLAGLRSGRLAEVLEEFVDAERAQIELRWRIWLSLAYPIVLLSIIAILLVFLQVVIMPTFVGVFQDFEVSLPAITKLFLQTAGPVTWVLGGALVLVAAAAFLVAAMRRVAWVPPLLYRVPLIGPLWRFGRLAQFSRLMGVLLEQAVPLPEALRLTAAGLRDAYLAEGCRQAADGVESGRPLAECLASQPKFPPSMIPLVDWGQRARAMADSFRASAEMFEGRVQTQGIFLETVLVPLMFLVIALFIGFFIVAMFLPLISLVQSLT
jgi:general secretion pathway protein F